jgi:hypothetical protein
MTDVTGGEDPWRRHLHAAVDYILDGPGSGDMDEWATQALASLGHFIRAAWLALDYEAGRIIAGDVDRRRGIFPAGGYAYPLWQGASIDVALPTHGAGSGAKHAAHAYHHPKPFDAYWRLSSIRSLVRPTIPGSAI